MPITILDYVKSVAGDKDSYTAGDFFGNGVAITGGCERCPATLGAYNAYPSTSGYWRCADCIGDTGYTTAEDFTATMSRTARCPSCGETSNINEIRITENDATGTDALECGECGEVWPL